MNRKMERSNGKHALTAERETSFHQAPGEGTRPTTWKPLGVPAQYTFRKLDGKIPSSSRYLATVRRAMVMPLAVSRRTTS